MKIAAAEVSTYRLPLTRPFDTGKGLLSAREGALLKLTLEDGCVRYGEAAPLPGFSRETLAEAVAQLQGHAHALPGQDASALRSQAEREPFPSVAFALDALAMQFIVGSIKAESVPVAALLEGHPEEALLRARKVVAGGCRALKLKVGRGEWREEARLVNEVRSVVGPEVALRMDANRAWDMETACAFGKAVANSRPAYIEEPLEDVSGLSAFSDACGIAYALDETLQQQMPDAIPDAILQKAKYLIWKPSLLPRKDLVAWRAAAHPLADVVLSASFESGIGTWAVAAAAHSLSERLEAAGLDTYSWLGQDLLREPLQWPDWNLNLAEQRRKLGINIRPELLQPIRIAAR